MNLPHHLSMEMLSAGHSDRAFSEFVSLLRAHRVTLLVDVRSWPYSKWVPHFNRTYFVKNLYIRYLWMGDTLGGRDEDITPTMFRRGIEELIKIARKERVCIMCSEGNPLPTKRRGGCHRYTKITPALERRGVKVTHI